VPRLQRKSFDEPETVREFPNGSVVSVALDETVLGRFRFEPGWRWSHDVRPIVGTDSCQNRHVGVCLEGSLHVQLDDGTTMDIVPNDAYEIPPGHDAWVVGDTAWLTYEWTSSRVFARAPHEEDDGVLVTLLFTDIVGSTATLERVGDQAWHELLVAHNAAMREQIGHYRGREVDTSGDGFLAMFDGPARAVRCGLAMAKAAQGLGLHIRVGCHTGDVMLVAGNARGVAVHMAARVMALANADEVLVSSTTRDLLAGSDFALEHAGTFELKGLTGARDVFRVID
jgi:class 3 adenylate cyclase